MNIRNILAALTLSAALAACGGSDAPAPAPTASLTVDKAAVNSGDTATLSWTSTHATACHATDGWSGDLATSGSQATAAITTATTFSLTCTTDSASSDKSSVTVSLVPTVTLTATPASVNSGDSTQLNWNSTDATACTAGGDWSGTLGANGSQNVGPLTGDATYTLTCNGAGGDSAPASVTVTVAATGGGGGGGTPPPGSPTVTLTAAPSSVTSGGTATLTWSSSNATACTASGGWTGSQPTSGSATTPALTATTRFTLTCTNSVGSGAATASVSIASGSLSPKTVALATGQAQTFTKTLSGTVNYTVDGVAGGNASVGTITTAGVYTAGTTTGSHTVLATSSTTATQTQSALAIVSDLTGITTYHGNDQRDGANTKEYALTPASVKTATFGKLASCTVDGAIAAQPLWVAQQTIGGAKHNVVYVATQHDGLYAFDADAATCTILWQKTLTDTAHGANAGETSVPWGSVGNGYGDIQPEVGVTGTPVIDLPNKILYVVSKTANAGGTQFYTRLHAIDLLTGLEKNGSPELISGSVAGTGTGGSMVAFDQQQELQRPGLALANGVVYVSFAAHEDNDPWFGWVFGYQYAAGTFTRTAIFNAAPNGKGAGIWMSAGAPAIDSAHNLYVLTGNGLFNANTGGKDYGDSLLKLSPALAVSQYWTPFTQSDDAAGDRDFGSGGAAVLADLTGSATPHVIICGGKRGVLEVLDRDALGGLQTSAGQTVIQEIPLGKGVFSTVAVWNNKLFAGAAGDSLRAYGLSTTTAQFTSSSASTQAFSWPGTTPTVSARGTSNGVVWAMEQNAYCTAQSKACGPAILHAYDANNLATELWKSSGVAADAAGNAVKFTTPTVANGHVYVGTRGNNTGNGSTGNKPGTLEIYGLKP